MFRFEGGDGTQAVQEGGLKQIGNEAGEVSQGSFSYTGDDGQNYAITYTADENGYRPQGAHLPQSPPIPDAILKSLEFLATKPPSKEDEQYNWGVVWRQQWDIRDLLMLWVLRIKNIEGWLIRYSINDQMLNLYIVYLSETKKAIQLLLFR